MNNRWMKAIASLAIAAVFFSTLASCAPATPEVVEKEVIVEKEVPVTVEVEKEVVVEKEVTKEVVVTATPVPKGGDLIVAARASGEGASFDGQVEGGIAGLFSLFLSDRLVYLTPEGEYIPWLATDWTLSPDQTTWTFSLREDVKFQDGTPFNAEAVKFNIDRVMDPDTHSLNAANWLGVSHFKEAEVVDEYTVKLTYEEPITSLLWGFVTTPFWSPAAVQEYGEDFKEHLVGCGPFKMTEWVIGSHVKFVKDPNYTGGPPAQEHIGPAYLDSITFKWVGEDAVLGQVLATGEVNMVMELATQFLPTYRDDPNFQIIPGYQSGEGLMFQMQTGKPPLDDIRVRRALRHAFDPKRANWTLYDGNYVEVYGPLTKFTRCYWKGVEEAYEYDPEKSKALLEEAGWVDADGDGVREKDGQPLAMSIIVLHHQELAEYISAQFRTIGVDLKVELLTPPVQQDRALSGEFDLIYHRLRGYEPDQLHSSWYSENLFPGGWAWSRFQNDRLDEILLQTQASADPEERCELFIEAQQILTEYTPLLPTLGQPIFYAMHKNVKGFRITTQFGYQFYANDMYVE